MKTIEIKESVFEPGDILNVENVEWYSTSKVIRDSEKIMIINARKSANGIISYKFIAQNGLIGKATHNMLQSAVYKEHVKAMDSFFRGMDF